MTVHLRSIIGRLVLVALAVLIIQVALVAILVARFTSDPCLDRVQGLRKPNRVQDANLGMAGARQHLSWFPPRFECTYDLDSGLRVEETIWPWSNR